MQAAAINLCRNAGVSGPLMDALYTLICKDSLEEPTGDETTNDVCCITYWIRRGS